MSYSFDKSDNKYSDNFSQKYNTIDNGFSSQENSNKFDYSSDPNLKTNNKEVEKNNKDKPLKIGVPNFDSFITNKHAAFWFFAQNAKSKVRISEDDISKYTQTSKSVDNIMSATYFGAMVFSFSADYYLRYSNMLYGITYKFSLGKFLFKYWVVPYVAVLGVSSAYINPTYKPVLDDIANKYDFREEFYREIYEEIPANKNLVRK